MVCKGGPIVSLFHPLVCYSDNQICPYFRFFSTWITEYSDKRFLGNFSDKNIERRFEFDVHLNSLFCIYVGGRNDVASKFPNGVHCITTHFSYETSNFRSSREDMQEM